MKYLWQETCFVTILLESRKLWFLRGINSSPRLKSSNLVSVLDLNYCWEPHISWFFLLCVDEGRHESQVVLVCPSGEISAECLLISFCQQDLFLNFLSLQMPSLSPFPSSCCCYLSLPSFFKLKKERQRNLMIFILEKEGDSMGAES